ncbi:interferon-induced protein 44-like isoform X2 [Hypomesus transpacificus]|uniref:interferon-induced protein 44-like isoform X2 n=1 Tax=Hypomesus transpacificus TaxID=137520 RepID=UPI001F074A52|nr:interferon-induced protein 44-like isoform X2 [Hypomesus transpacificus]
MASGLRNYWFPSVPSAVLEKPWREAAWNNRDQMIEKLRTFPLNDPELGMIRILLHGPVGAGKSSFINSVKSAFAGRVVMSVLVDALSSFSFTNKYETHFIKEGEGRLPFVFNDVMGLETMESRGVHIDDIISALKGHIPEDYEFNPSVFLTNSKPEYIQDPKLSDKVHCLVSVVSADKMSMMSKDTKDKMRTVREKASLLGIPQIVVMTMVDTACPEVARDLKNIYRSKHIKSMMQSCSNELGVPVNCILPVKNYHEETQGNNDIDVLVLEAMTKIVEVANDYIWHVQQKKKHLS